VFPALYDAAEDVELRDSALRVLYFLAYKRLSPVEWRPVKRLALSRDLHISERTIDDALSSLIQRGYLEAGKRVPGSPQTYRLVFSRTKVA
jgi:hypothetical protein